MPPRKKPGQPAKPTLTIGAGALVVGLIYLLVWLVKTYPREACAVGVALCREHLPAAPAPVVTIAPMPDDLLPGQMPATHGCPSPYVEVRGKKGCWGLLDKRPPCGMSFEHEGRCYSAYIPPQPFRAVQQPWDRR